MYVAINRYFISFSPLSLSQAFAYRAIKRINIRLVLATMLMIDMSQRLVDFKEK